MKLYDILCREASIKLASLDKRTDEYKELKFLYDKVSKVVKVLDDVSNSEYYSKQIIYIINKLIDTNLLSPLTLKDDEFDNTITDVGFNKNIRYPHIAKHNNKIYNCNAFSVEPKKVYSHDEQIELNQTFISNSGNKKVFISKGGIITGEYIEDCIIRQDVVNKGCFTIQSVLRLPVSVITYGVEHIYVVDHREPKLKVLNAFYEVPILYDEKIHNKKFNIRKYKKL